jgi:hypothetical protein
MFYKNILQMVIYRIFLHVPELGYVCIVYVYDCMHADVSMHVNMYVLYAFHVFCRSMIVCPILSVLSCPA